MREITQDELKEILEQHKLWLNDNTKGCRANLSYAYLYNANLSNANLSYAYLHNARLSNANLQNANLHNANLSNAYLHKADLSHADLSNANLSYAYLSNANLSNANLSYAYLHNARLSHADLSNANLSYAYLSNADLSRANLSNANIVTFQFKKHIAYFTGKDLRIGCKTETLQDWQNDYEEIGKKNDYTEQEIKMYGRFIEMCIEIQNEET